MVDGVTSWISEIQARTQGFEKGGYIVKKIPIDFLAF